MVCGIIGLVLFLAPYIGIILSILAVIFSAKQKKIKVTGQSTTGNVLGIVGIVINALILFCVIIFLIIIGGQ